MDREVTIRHGRPDDDYSRLPCPTDYSVPWNWANTYVAVRDGQVVGAIVFWEAGHPVVYVACFQVAEAERGHYIGYRLMEAVEQHALSRGAAVIMGTAVDPDYIATAQRFGAVADPRPHTLLTRVIT